MFGFCGRMRSNLAKFLLLHSLRTNLWSLYGFFSLFLCSSAPEE